MCSPPRRQSCRHNILPVSLLNNTGCKRRVAPKQKPLSPDAVKQGQMGVPAAVVVLKQYMGSVAA